MQYMCNLIAVKNIEHSKAFYQDVLGQQVVEDLGANVTLTGGFALQTTESWQDFIHKNAAEIAYGGHDAELVFEETDMDGFLEKLKKFDVEYVHPLQEHEWGQRVIRFYDLDRHIIEVGENMAVVVRRFLDSGMTVEETAVRMAVPVEYVRELL